MLLNDQSLPSQCSTCSIVTLSSAFVVVVVGVVIFLLSQNQKKTPSHRNARGLVASPKDVGSSFQSKSLRPGHLVVAVRLRSHSMLLDTKIQASRLSQADEFSTCSVWTVVVRSDYTVPRTEVLVSKTLPYWRSTTHSLDRLLSTKATRQSCWLVWLIVMKSLRCSSP